VEGYQSTKIGIPKEVLKGQDKEREERSAEEEPNSSMIGYAVIDTYNMELQIKAYAVLYFICLVY